MELTKRHQKVFCSNRCQRAAERAVNVARWLATGVGAPGSGQGHYIRDHLFREQGGLCAICAARTATCCAAGCGVVTTSASARGSS